MDGLKAQVKSLEAVVEGYMLMVGGRVETKGNGRWGVKMINAADERVMEFRAGRG